MKPNPSSARETKVRGRQIYGEFRLVRSLANFSQTAPIRRVGETASSSSTLADLSQTTNFQPRPAGRLRFKHMGWWWWWGSTTSESESHSHAEFQAATGRYGRQKDVPPVSKPRGLSLLSPRFLFSGVGFLRFFFSLSFSSSQSVFSTSSSFGSSFFFFRWG